MMSTPIETLCQAGREGNNNNNEKWTTNREKALEGAAERKTRRPGSPKKNTHT